MCNTNRRFAPHGDLPIITQEQEKNKIKLTWKCYYFLWDFGGGRLTHKQLETHGYVLSTVTTNVLVVISIHRAE